MSDFDRLEVFLDRENPNFVFKALDNIEDILKGLKNEELDMNFEILRARTFFKLERVNKAKDIYENLCLRYPNEPRPFLYLAEYYLIIENYEENEKLLKKASEIDRDYWLLKLEKIIRKLHLDNQIDISNIDENSFPDENRIKSNFYRIYAIILAKYNEHERAISFIERAIHYNPDRFNNYDAKLTILAMKLFDQSNSDRISSGELDHYLSEIEDVEKRVNEWGEITPRTKAILNLRKSNAYFAQENIQEIEKIAEPTFQFLISCHFDHIIDGFLINFLMQLRLSNKALEELEIYLEKAKKPISKDLLKMIAIQYAERGNLTNNGIEFFTKINEKAMVEFINNVKENNYNQAWNFLEQDQNFAVSIAVTLKENPSFRNVILERLPDNDKVQKEKILFFINYKENNIDDAFKHVKAFDFSKTSYYECKPILEIAEKKEAWDDVILLANKLLPREKEQRAILQLKLQLFNAYNHLNNYSEVIRIGEELLCDDHAIETLDEPNKEALLGQTIQARLRRSEYTEAKTLLVKYVNFSNTFDFKIAIEAEVYIKNNEGEKALASVVSTVKTLKNPSPEQYGILFAILTEIGNMIDLPLTSMDKITKECFVKLKDQERWYFVGDGDELDATPIPINSPRYSAFINKEISEYIDFRDRYGAGYSKSCIEYIFPIEKYIIWKCFHHAQELTRQGRWDKMEMIELPPIGETIDPQYLIAKLEEESNKRGSFFDLFRRQSMPLAYLAINEGGLFGAIGRIVNENTGFIRFSSGDPSEMESQKYVASKIIAGEPFYIDGTSALMLSESGFFDVISKYVTGLIVPQSVIAFLYAVKEKFVIRPGHTGFMRYIKGKLNISPVDHDLSLSLQDKIERGIKFLELEPERIKMISNVNKSTCFSEQRVPPELCDACILAQNENANVLTEDFLYLQANELETKKKKPDYCSSFFLIRILYEQKKIPFDQYLKYFCYLASYRFRFLPISLDDINKATFGDSAISIVRPARIRFLDLDLTLSPEYGVPFDVAFILVGKFLLQILSDDSITTEISVQIYTEILYAFPTKMNKTAFGNLLLNTISRIIENRPGRILVRTNAQEKLERLYQITALYGGKGPLLN